MAEQEREETVENIGKTRNALRDSFTHNAPNIKENVFNFLDGISILLTAYYKSGGLEGWTAGVHFSDGRGLSPEDGKYIEDIFSSNSHFLDILKGTTEEEPPQNIKQKGGAGKLKVRGASMFGEAQKGLVSLDKPVDFDISIDRGINKLVEYNTMIDDQVRSITDQIGPTAFISSLPTDPFITLPFIPRIQIPKYSILPFLDAILEVLRLTTIFMPFDMPAFRKIMSISKAIFELSDGNWRQAILSFIGYFGQNMGRMSSMAKIMMQAWMMIDPTISSKIASYTYKGIKSMFITFWLWVFHVVSPDYVWIPIGKFLESINGMIDSSQEQIDKLSETFTKQLKGMGYDGYSVTLPTIEQMVGLPNGSQTPLRFSFDDLQNIQALITMPFFLCSKEGQTIIQQFTKTPIRLVLELLNIPTTPEDVSELCGQADPTKMKSLVTSIADNVVKETHIRNPSGAILVGGLARLPRSTSRKRGGHKKQKKTRRR